MKLQALLVEIIRFLLESAKKTGDNAAHQTATRMLAQFEDLVATEIAPAIAPVPAPVVAPVAPAPARTSAGHSAATPQKPVA